MQRYDDCAEAEAVIFKHGESYVCTHSASPGYTTGKEYKCYRNSDGNTCFKADDGYEDLTVMLVSKFKKK